jgi:glycosyltransferase involved in cell wall biosynthesis
MSQGAAQKSVQRLVVISPCRDEETHIEATIRSMVAQTRLPDRWIVVDDGSTDRTPEILSDAAEEHEFLEVVRREDRGARRVGPGVIDAFYAGIDSVDLDDFEFVCKLDCDLELPPRYFEFALAEMARDPALGTFSGKVYLRDPDGEMILERRGDENSVGPAKLYRVACFREIDGFARAVGWDGVDGHMCRLKGWVAASENRDELRIVHRRQVGSSDRNIFRGRVRAGAGRWFIGSSLPFVLAVAVSRTTEAPYVIGALLMLYGYLRSMLRREPRFGNKQYRRSLRRYEWRVLLRGKRTVLAQANDRIRRERATPP